jgi:hypothetical protein
MGIDSCVEMMMKGVDEIGLYQVQEGLHPDRKAAQAH